MCTLLDIEGVDLYNNSKETETLSGCADTLKI